MSESVLQFAADGGVATITLNDPARRNAMSREMCLSFDEALVEAARDATIRALVISANGPVFCAGGDMARLGDYAQSVADPNERNPNVPSDFFDVLPGIPPELRTRYTFPMALPFPVIAAVGGAAIGAGFVLALHCDIRIASPAAAFQTGFARIGATPEIGMSWTLPGIVGAGVARELMLTGRRLGAEEALQRGLVSRIVEAEALLPVALDLARDLAESISPRSVASIKRQLFHAPAQSFADAYFESAREAVDTFSNADFHEGIAAFKERRRPKFGSR